MTVLRQILTARRWLAWLLVLLFSVPLPAIHRFVDVPRSQKHAICKHPRAGAVAACAD